MAIKNAYVVRAVVLLALAECAALVGSFVAYNAPLRNATDTLLKTVHGWTSVLAVLLALLATQCVKPRIVWALACLNTVTSIVGVNAATAALCLLILAL